MQTAQKSFFQERTIGQIKKLEKIVTLNSLDSLIGSLIDIDSEQYIIYSGETYPSSYNNCNKFKKHGMTVKLQRSITEKNAINSRLTPSQKRDSAFNKLNKSTYRGYDYKRLGLDNRTIIVPLRECVEALRLFIYDINISSGRPLVERIYEDTKRVYREGGDIVVSVPSRRKKISRYNIKMYQFPLIDTPEKYFLINKLYWNHSCEHSEYRKMRRKYEFQQENSNEVTAVAQVITGYWKVMYQQYKENQNIIPLQMNPFAIPTQFTMDIYKKVRNNLVIEKNNKLVKPTAADVEVILWELVRQKGNKHTFFATQKILEYDL